MRYVSPEVTAVISGGFADSNAGHYDKLKTTASLPDKDNNSVSSTSVNAAIKGVLLLWE
jgi:hypothetical protein